MGVTRMELEAHEIARRQAKALERIADAMEKLASPVIVYQQKLDAVVRQSND